MAAANQKSTKNRKKGMTLRIEQKEKTEHKPKNQSPIGPGDYWDMGFGGCRGWWGKEEGRGGKEPKIHPFVPSMSPGTEY